MLVSIAAKLNLTIKFFGVKTAYVYNDLTEAIYMSPPQGFKEAKGGGKIIKLKKRNYGLLQSDRKWHIKIKSVLKKLG